MGVLIGKEADLDVENEEARGAITKAAKGIYLVRLALKG